ncbi:MAG TPA: ATP-binding cassette domain-containing protein, partial [Patescibacteria group bacterium]|nr:ATP-binding cassette domain-containing protein [Patescibacteria group bacterium]
LRAVALASWTRLVGYIPQQAQVLDGTLRYNLLYGLPEKERGAVTDEELWDVMRKLQIDFGERLTEGLDTVVGRRGIKLSGGQAQRLMIGAAVLKRPRFMIIDEATSSLDSTTEKAVQEGLAKVLPKETSALIITHRLSTVRSLCTKFIVLRTAEAVADGTPQVEAVAGSFEELYAVSPTFRRLADDQGVHVASAARHDAFGPMPLCR